MNRKLTSSITFIMALAFGFTKAQLAGNYTIGGTTPDYATVIDAVNDLNLQGISAPVVFNIRDGVYPGKVILTTITGATFTNTVTFQSESGDSTLVTLTDPTTSTGGSNYLISMTNADYINFNQVTLERSGTLANSCVIAIAGGCDYNNFTNCVITTGNTTGTSNFSALVYSVTTTSDNYNVFMNNRVENGSYGFYFFSSPTTLIEDGNMIMNNSITGQTNYGLQVGSQSEFMVSGNYIMATTTSYASAIYASTLSGNSIIMDNKIDLADGGTGISLQQSNGGAGAEIMIANNFVSIGLANASGQAYGIRTTACSNTGVYFNNVNIYGTVTVANNFAFNAVTAGANLNLFNNVFSATTGYVVGISDSAVTQMNYNDLYTTGFNFGLIDGATNYGDLASWQGGTSFDTNSVSADPLFVSTTDLHVLTFALNAVAIPVAGITTDIDGDLRDVATPDIGADETTPPSNDVGVTKLLKPLNGSCGSINTEVAAIVRNYAALPQTNISVVAEVSGTQTATLTGTITGPITVYGSDTVWFTPTLNTYAGDSLIIKVYTTTLNDEDNTNDTLEVDSIYINAIPAPPTVPAIVTTCLGTSVSINATFPASQQVYWYTSQSGGPILQTGNPLIVNPGDTTIYYAEVSDTASSGIGCLRITEAELNDIGGNGDYIEIQNCSAHTIDATGWVVSVSGDVPTDVNSVNISLWQLGVFAPGEIQYRYDAGVVGDPNYWGTNILWNPSAEGWAMILDNNGQIIDFAGWQHTLPILQSASWTINGFTVTLGSQWLSDGATACLSGNSVNRIGNTDNDNATDFNCQIESMGVQNAGLILPFTACGGGCPSDRVPVEVDVIAPPTVFLGNDTTIAAPNTVTLDPGAGFVSYAWSDGSSTQTIVASASGNYTVTVTDANGCTGSDVIAIIVLTGINDFGANSQVILSPIPARDDLKVTLKNMAADDYTITLLNNLGQRIMSSNINVHDTNVEKTFSLSGYQKGVYYVEVKSDKGIYRQRILKQ